MLTILLATKRDEQNQNLLKRDQNRISKSYKNLNLQLRAAIKREIEAKYHCHQEELEKV